MSYWKNRQQQLNRALEKDEERLKKRLSFLYAREAARLDKEIASYYAKYSIEGVIEYRKLMEKLSDDDIRLLMERMDEFAAKYPQYEHLLPIRESIYKLNRLEGLQASIRMQQLEIGVIENAEMQAHLNQNAMRGVNAAAETLGFGKSFYYNNPDITKLFVNVPWADGKNFSQRIWDNTNKLANYLAADIAQGFARGDSYERLVRNLRDRFENVSRNDAYRMIYTEGTFVMAEATMQPFKEDFTQYRISTVGDGKVCPICRGMAEQVFNIADRVPGTNFPPFHPWCRCTFEIVVDDWDAWMDAYVAKHSGDRKQAKKVANRMVTENEKLNREYKKLSLDEFKKMHHTVTKEERRILYGKSHFSGYINSSNARKMNGLLRSGGSLNAEYQEIADTLSSVIQKNSIPEDISVVRYVNTDALESISGVSFPDTVGIFAPKEEIENFWKSIDGLKEKIQVGHKYIEKGFLSTSGVVDKNVMTDKGVKINIKIPKDTNAYITTNYKESEIIFDKGTEIEILDVHIEDNRSIKVKVVLDCIMR